VTRKRVDGLISRGGHGHIPARISRVDRRKTSPAAGRDIPPRRSRKADIPALSYTPASRPLRPVVVRFPAGLLAAIDAAVREKRGPELRSWQRLNRSDFIQKTIADALKVSSWNGEPIKEEE